MTRGTPQRRTILAASGSLCTPLLRRVSDGIHHQTLIPSPVAHLDVELCNRTCTQIQPTKNLNRPVSHDDTTTHIPKVERIAPVFPMPKHPPDTPPLVLSATPAGNRRGRDITHEYDLLRIDDVAP